MGTDRDGTRGGRWAALYGQVLDALEELLAGLDPAAGRRVVPATPEWTVHQVVAHLAGSASDVTTGRMDGAPQPQWTARHVAERADTPIAELLTELRSTERSFGVISEGASAGVYNAVVHHADLTEALGAPRQSEALFLPVLLDQRHRWSALSLRLPDEADPTGGRPVDPYLLSRALFTRLDRVAVRDLVGEGPSDAEIDGLGLFGPPGG